MHESTVFENDLKLLLKEHLNMSKSFSVYEVKDNRFRLELLKPKVEK